MIREDVMRTLLGTAVIALGLCACGDDSEPPPASDTSTTGCGNSVFGSPGCNDTDFGTTGTPTPPPTPPPADTTSSPSDSSSSDDGPSTVGIPDECQVSADCDRGELCVAPFMPEWGPEGKGPHECVTECVVLMDELRWCLDATACCDPEAECTDRGYCVLPGESTGTDDGGEDTEGGSTSA